MARRLTFAVLLLAILTITGLAAWRWWSDPPHDRGERLGAALGYVPRDASGAFAIGQPRQAGRWVALHPQALVLATYVAPQLEGALGRLRPLLESVATGGDGPLVVWWRSTAVGFAAPASPGTREAAIRVAGRLGLAVATRSEWLAVGTDARALDGFGDGTAGQAPPHPAAVLARVDGREWTGIAGRDGLVLTSGRPPAPPEEIGSVVRTANLGAMLARFSPLLALLDGPACLQLTEGGQWAIALPHTTLPDRLGPALRGKDPQPAGAVYPGAERWDGILGRVLALPSPGVRVATDAAGLGRVAGCAGDREEGQVRGADLAYLATRAGRLGRALPGLDLTGWEDSAAVIGRLKTLRWRLTADGGVIELEW